MKKSNRKTMRTRKIRFDAQPRIRTIPRRVKSVEVEIKDPKLDLFIENEKKYLVKNPNKPYTIDDFLVKFQRHINIHSPNYISDYDEQKKEYLELVINRFKTLETDFIIDNPEIGYTKQLFDDHLKKYSEDNSLNLPYFQFTKRDEISLFNDIVDEAGKFTFNAKNLLEKEITEKEKSKSVSVNRGLYTKFIQRFNQLESAFDIYKSNANKTEKDLNNIKNKITKFIEYKPNLFSKDQLTLIKQESDYEDKQKQIEEFFKYLTGVGVPTHHDDSLVVKPIRSRKAIKIPKSTKKLKQEKAIIEEKETDDDEYEDVIDEVINEVIPTKDEMILEEIRKYENSIMKAEKSTSARVKKTRSANIKRWQQKIKELMEKLNTPINSTPLKKDIDLSEEVFEKSLFDSDEKLPDVSLFKPSVINAQNATMLHTIIDLEDEFTAKRELLFKLDKQIKDIDAQINRLLNVDTNDAEAEDLLTKLNERKQEFTSQYAEEFKELENIKSELETLKKEAKLEGQGLDIDALIDSLINEHLYGSGILDSLKNFGRKVVNVFTNSYSPTVEKAINQYGDWKVAQFYVGRTPVEKVLQKVLNFLSLGKFGEYKYNYDDLYHLFCILQIEDGNGNTMWFRSEKRPNIEWKKNDMFKSEPNTMFKQYAITSGITVKQMFENAMKILGNKKWASYDPVLNNCQDYLLAIEHALGLNFADVFIKQNIETLTGFARKVATATTSIAHFIGRLQGKSKPKKRNHKKKKNNKMY